LARDRVNQFIGEALMIALAMVVLDVLGDRAPEMALAERDDPIEAFLLDRPHEAFGVGIRVRRLVSQITTRRDQLSASVRFRPTWRMNAPSGCGVDPSTWTRRDARSMTKTV
jgi:hypothetical protein